MIGRT